MLLVGMIYRTGQCFNNVLGLAVVAQRSAHYQTARHWYNRDSDSRRRKVKVAVAALVLSSKNVFVIDVSVKHQGPLSRFDCNSQGLFGAELNADLNCRRSSAGRYIDERTVCGWRIDRFLRKAAYDYSPEIQPRTSDQAGASSVINQSEPNNRNRRLVSDGAAVKRDQFHIEPRTLKVCQRPFRQVSLAFDGPQSEESYEDVGSGDSDHDPFSDSRLWSYMVGALMFLLGYGLAAQAARLWIDCGRLRLSLCCVAAGFSLLYFGQAFVLFGFWWL